MPFDQYEKGVLGDPTLDKTLTRPMDMRTFPTGAIRDQNTDKLDYRGFLSMRAIKRFAQYMHKHRKLADGSLRDADNWKKGIPIRAYEESLFRHTMEFYQLIERERAESSVLGSVADRAKAMEIAEAMFFNLQGWMHEVDKQIEEASVQRGAQADAGAYKDIPREPQVNLKAVQQNDLIKDQLGFPIGYTLRTVSGFAPKSPGSWELMDYEEPFTWRRIA